MDTLTGGCIHATLKPSSSVRYTKSTSGHKASSSACSRRRPDPGNAGSSQPGEPANETTRSCEVRRVSADDPAVYALRSELFEFEQVFDRPDRSRGVLRLRATLDGKGIWAQRTFAIEKPAPTADAAGG
jgi:hypothetical protein